MPNYYGSVESADAYHQARGNSAWTAADNDKKEASLLRGSEWVDFTYRSRFPGKKAGGRSQVREWPRIDAKDADGDDIGTDEIPAEVENSSYEAALRELVSPGSLSPDSTGSLVVKREKKKVAGLEKEVEYFEGDASGVPSISNVDNILLPILLPVAGGKIGVAFLKRA